MTEAPLRCDACGTLGGRYDSYEEWEDAARRLGWFVGEELVLCDVCAEPDGLKL